MSTVLKRILYAEDEKDIQNIIRISLEEIGGFDIKICSSGEELLASYEEFSPDLILLDVMMPGLSGVETYTALKELPQFDDTPVVFVTAKVQANEILAYKELGAIEVINKPFNPMELPERLRQIWQAR
ncbi:MAG: response regulator [Gammaproteobacteria bacterium]|nr:response regulator [Gammaproteobacteria bacterium]